jgi:enamine deaminase RidA (YjgF/YER057c/UK114 family)
VTDRRALCTFPRMHDNTLAKIESLGLKLPEVPQPVAAYVNWVRTGNLLFLSGGLPIDGDVKILGKVPSVCPVEKAVEASRIIILNRLAVIKEAIGSLDNVKQIVTLNGFVNSDPDFTGHPVVVNGASELLVEIFGERGKHSRTAIGVAALPLDVSVEINLIVEVV